MPQYRGGGAVCKAGGDRVTGVSQQTVVLPAWGGFTIGAWIAMEILYRGP